ncbi:MAG: sigma 54-interacting transcriptional regulator [Candidatus Zixiibacteriota bacterium]|nr:MAG: sigma 54-interacting transcriptional regulator [candidate division Zixibacteria bacterium]
MDLSSPKLSIDNRLLAVEEFLRQRLYREAIPELSKLNESEFAARDHELGFFLTLRADCHLFDGNYRSAIEDALRAARLLANTPLNLRYGQAQIVLCKAYITIGETKNAEIRGRDALAAFRRVNNSAGQVDALNCLARIAYMRSRYREARDFLEDALVLVEDNQRQRAFLTGNLGRIRMHTGEWEMAEKELSETLDYWSSEKVEVHQAANLLALGFLKMRQRKFILASRDFDQALEIIGRLGLRREKVIYLEYAGELALSKGDTYKAKALMSDAYEKGMLLAPESAMVAQSARLLAEVELRLDNIDEAMKYGQKALDVASKIGEKVEVGLAYRVIAQAFASKNDFDDAFDTINQALQIVSEVGDPLETARTLQVMAEIKVRGGSSKIEKIRDTFEKSRRLFRELGLEYWVAEVDYRSGAFACQSGDFGDGFVQLGRAEKMFEELNEKSRLRAVHKYLRSLSEQAVTAAMSPDNEFRLFGNLVSPAEISDISSGDIDEMLDILMRRTGSDRAVVYTPDAVPSTVWASFTLTPNQVKKFRQNFENLLGEEISKTRPTLVLDSRRDPFINGLFAETVDTVSSMLVVPFKMDAKTPGYLYLDRLTADNSINAFSQTDLNFAVGFSSIIAFKWAEIQKSRLMEDNLRLKDQLRQKAAFPNIITQNAEMLDILAQVRQVVNSNISITVEGETGSGKDLVVRAIHYNSDRRDKRFISVNCAALPETLLESELFGYKRGAFTGADRDKAGLFEEADGGTFFLDEIGDMPLNIQAKVLRVLEEKELVRLGETVPCKVDVRIISATNKDLKELMSSGQFRQDLYYRLSALTFRLPSLRERRDDIPLLVNHFLADSGKQVSPQVMKLLVCYDWPGNVRELENEVKKLVLLAGTGPEVTPDLVSARIASAVRPDPFVKARQVEDADDIVFDDKYSLYDYLAYHEKRFIIKALKEKNGVKKHAAELLNIPESTLRLKIKQYSINLKNPDSSL